MAGTTAAESSVDARLERGLVLHGPGTFRDAPATLTFSRTRSVDMPWVQLAEIAEARGQGDEADGFDESRQSIRSYFEASWGVERPGGATPTRSIIEQLFADGRIMAPTYPNLHEAAEGQELSPGQLLDNTARAAEPYGRFWVDAAPLVEADSSTPQIEQILNGVVVRHGSGRTYQLQSDGPLSHVDFLTDYRGSWQAVTGFRVVTEYQIPEDEDSPHEIVGPRAVPTGYPVTSTSMETVDMRAPFIEARGLELLALRELNRKLSSAASRAVDSQIDTVALDAEATAELESRYLNAKMGLHRVERQLQLLKQQAAEMGYGLSLVDADYDAQGNQTKAAACNLTISTPVEVTWTPTVTITSYVGWLWPHKIRTVIKLPPRTKTVMEERPINTTEDVLAKRVDELAREGRDVHVFDLTPGGYVTADGQALELLMMQCGADEARRLRTVLMLPNYELSLTGERVVVSYTVFHRPAPGTQPIAFPELEIVEHLSYKTVWKQAELGELVSTINLAPGEKRTITVTRTFDRETSTSSTSKSVFDLSSSESTDLATEMERTARNETDVTTKVGAEVSANASWGWGSASAKVNASHDRSVKNVGTDMAKSAQKAASSVNQNRREEMETTTTSKTTVHTSDSSVSEIENINQGRSLNLMFYRIFNRYEGRLFLDNLQIRVRSGVEVVAGSGIRAERVFSVAQIADAIEELADNPIPVPGSPDVHWELRQAILTNFTDHAFAEYSDLRSVDDDEPVVRLSGGKGLDKLAPPKTKLIAPLVAAQNAIVEHEETTGRRGKGKAVDREAATAARMESAESAYRSELSEVVASFADLEISDRDVHRSDLLVAASGLYLDSTVGLRPATEPYSELRRELEIRRQEAEVANLWSESTRKQALSAHLIGSNGTGSARPFDTLVVVDWAADEHGVLVTLDRPLGSGVWDLTRNGTTLGLLVGDAGDPHRYLGRGVAAGELSGGGDGEPLLASHRSTGYSVELLLA